MMCCVKRKNYHHIVFKGTNDTNVQATMSTTIVPVRNEAHHETKSMSAVIDRHAFGFSAFLHLNTFKCVLNQHIAALPSVTGALWVDLRKKI